MTKTTDPQEELLTEVDKDNHILGSISRKVAHKSPDKIYRTIFILVKNNKGKILFQKRSATKDLYPNCWDLSVGGHVNFGKSYNKTAVRELGEELGISAQEEELKFVGQVLVKLPESNEFFHVFEYILKKDDQINTAKDEISETKWMTIDEVKESMKEKTLKWYERPIQIIEALY